MTNPYELDNLSKDELIKLQKDVNEAIEQFDQRRMQDCVAALRATAKEHGFSLEDVLKSNLMKGSGKSSLPPKYVDPDDPKKTWSGRGRQPEWFKSHIEAGKTAEELEI